MDEEEWKRIGEEQPDKGPAIPYDPPEDTPKKPIKNKTTNDKPDRSKLSENLGKAADIASKLANMTSASQYRSVDFSTRAPDPGGEQKGMDTSPHIDITKASDPGDAAGGTFGDDDAEYKKKKKQYGL